MKLPQFLPAAAFALCATAAARAGVATVVSTWSGVNLEIPDGPVSGDPTTVSDSRSISTSFSSFSDLTVFLEFEGSDGAGGAGTMWNGDLVVRLSHESGASVVLLNRIGRDTGSPAGNSGNGMAVTLDGSALADVHLASSGVLSGSYQPDGRSASPSTVVAASLRDATFDPLLTSMGAGSPNGLWTLSVTDVDSGSLARLKGWSLALTGFIEPPSATPLLAESHCVGETATFTTTASGAGPFTFVWKKGATTLADGGLGGRASIVTSGGGTVSTLTITGLQFSDADAAYNVTVSGVSEPPVTRSAALSVNRPPVATSPGLQTTVNKAVSFPTAKLAKDPDGDALVFTPTSPTAGGGTVTVLAGVLTYTPATGFTGDDAILYSVEDSAGCTSSGAVAVTVGSGNGGSLNIVGGPSVVAGNFVVTFAGVPGLSYTIERAPAANGPWQKAVNFTAPTTDLGDGVGRFTFTEPTDSDPSRFYRTRYPAY